jgi:two-component system cell cycle sensor histidine kinase/response regulator CckA
MLPPPAFPRADVLIVDDDAGVRDVCTSLLHALGYRASLAEGPAQALASLSSDGAQVTLALVDMELPGAEDGSLLRALRNKRPDLRVLLMSGRPRDNLQRFLAAGADAVLEKPFRLGELDQSLDDALLGTRSNPRPTSARA